MRYLLPFLLIVSCPTWGQEQLKLEWPRTFTGQPDFAFTREEAIAETRARAARNGDASPQIPSLLTLAADETLPDPLRLRKVEEPQADGTLKARDDDALAALNMALVPTAVLPTYATPTTPDLTEFRATLAQTISATIAAWQPNPAQFELAQVVNTLVLQAIVTSPSRYAVINGGRYTEGSGFLMRIPVAVPDILIKQALTELMPTAGTFDDATFAAYGLAYQEALANYAAAQQANPEVGQQALNLPVVVKQIQTRKVVVEIQGRRYELGMRYQY